MADSHSTNMSSKPRTGSMSQASESSQTAAEYALYEPYMCNHVDNVPKVHKRATQPRSRSPRGSTLRKQYTTMGAGFGLTTAAIRHVYARSWSTSSKPLRMSHLQPAARGACSTAHSSSCLLLMLHLLPRRTHTCRTFQQAELLL